MATATTTRLGPADQGRAMTLAEYLDAEVEEGHRYELARGVLEVTNVPNESHGLVVFTMYCRLAAYTESHPGQIYRFGGAGEFHFVLPGLVSGRNPDLAVVLVGTPRDGRGHSRPALAMEVVSPGAKARHRDHVIKREEYLAFGLDEYWVIDPFDRRVLVLCRDGDVWTERSFVAGQEAEGRALPGFRVAVDALWAAYDRGGVDGPEDA